MPPPLSAALLESLQDPTTALAAAFVIARFPDRMALIAPNSVDGGVHTARQGGERHQASGAGQGPGGRDGPGAGSNADLARGEVLIRAVSSGARRAKSAYCDASFTLEKLEIRNLGLVIPAGEIAEATNMIAVGNGENRTEDKDDHQQR